MAPPAAAAASGPAASDRGRRAGPSIGTALMLLGLAWGAAVAGFPLTDNSFFTHLATGRLILDEGAVPSADPYTFTAGGTDWTVQSWLASVVYAGAERAGGVAGLRVVVLVMFVAGAALLWRLSRPCTSLVPRIAIVFGSLYVVTNLWGERPYMVGVLGLGVMWLALDRAVPTWSLIPLYWVWANSHGSFPLGLALALAVLVGRRLDGRAVDHEARVLGFSVLGTLAAVIGPLGPEVLLFPLTALTRSDVLVEVVEWQPPSYESTEMRLYLVLVVATVLALVRRPSWGNALPAVAFVAAAVVAQRNVVMAVMVLVPVLAQSAPSVGSLTVEKRPALARAFAAVGVAALALATVSSLTSPLGGLGGYPAAALAWTEGTALTGEPTATQDIVGNLLEGLDGAEARAFNDDRVDMLPEDLVDDGLVLLRGGHRWEQVLDERGVAVVVWDRRRPLGSLVAADHDWRVVFSDTRWTVACRRDSRPCTDQGS